jgi:hypothetical protein
MDEEIKVNFSRPMMVLKIRETYKAPYHKNKYITIKKRNAESMVELKKHIQEYTGNWSSGTYDIQFVYKEGTYMQPTIYSTFCRIDVQNGKVVKIWKVSPYSRKVYPCWQYFVKKPRKKSDKKKKSVRGKPLIRKKSPKTQKKSKSVKKKSTSKRKNKGKK